MKLMSFFTFKSIHKLAPHNSEKWHAHFALHLAPHTQSQSSRQTSNNRYLGQIYLTVLCKNLLCKKAITIGWI